MSASTETIPVLIVGAGPSGLAAALTLAQNGIPIRVIDKAQEYHQSSRGSGLHPRTLEVFRFLGVAEDAHRRGRPLMPMQLYKLPGGTEPVANWKILEDVPISPDRPEDSLLLSQYLMEEIFRDHLSKYGVQVELGTEPVSMEQDDTGVSLSLRHAGVEEVETVRCAYVISADGARGFTRKAIGAMFEGQTKEDDGQAWADVEAEGVSSDFWHVWTEPGKFTVALRPKKEPGHFHLGIAGQNFDPVGLTEPFKFAEFFYELTGRRDIVFKNFVGLSYWKPKTRMVNKLSKGRVFICGDAAHIHSPSGGQGLNTSVGDAFNIAWKLALVCKGLASRDLLTTYNTERLPVIADMLAITADLYTPLVKSKADDNAGLGGSDKGSSGFMKWRNNALRQLDINYRWSPVVLDARGMNGLDGDALKAGGYHGYPGEPMRAGDRAPEAPALVDASGKETSLFEIFKPNAHTVLVFSPEHAGSKAQEVVAAAQASPLASVMKTLVLGRDGVPAAIEGANAYHDKEGHAQKAYGVDDQGLTIVVVRPDGHIGAFVNDVDVLQTYISRIVGGFV
ncbi:FAD binding domain-containing protein [Cerioporus squamosus]|nr:FAD binding domain-containing protein [Cerioporus squamosus]